MSRGPFQTTPPTHRKGLPGSLPQPSSPSGPLVSRGVPARLKATMPAADAATVRAMAAAGQDGETSGSEGLDAPAPKSNGAIPGRASLVPPDGFNVP